eukprot:gene2186-33801_t
MGGKDDSDQFGDDIFNTTVFGNSSSLLGRFQLPLIPVERGWRHLGASPGSRSLAKLVADVVVQWLGLSVLERSKAAIGSLCGGSSSR